MKVWRRANATYRRIVETANDGIWMLDDRLATIFANQRLASLLGYTVSEMLGRSLFDFVFEAGLASRRSPICDNFLSLSVSNSRDAIARRMDWSCGRLFHALPRSTTMAGSPEF